MTGAKEFMKNKTSTQKKGLKRLLPHPHQISRRMYLMFTGARFRKNVWWKPNVNSHDVKNDC